VSWLWFDLCPDPATGTVASARVSDANGTPRGVLCAWASDQDRPTPTAAKVDSRAIDPSGEPGSVSLVLAPDGLYLPFDDPAVAHATRMILAMTPADVCSTLVDGDDRFRGSLTGTHGDDGRLGYDPFGVLFPAVVLRVEAGILGRMSSPVGPVTQRYGATNPWPWDRFEPA